MILYKFPAVEKGAVDALVEDLIPGGFEGGGVGLEVQG